MTRPETTSARLPNVRWDAAGYRANSAAQAAWGAALHDQLALTGDETLFDLGCGDGRLTAGLAARVPHGRVVGFDADPGMIALARRSHAAPNLEFVQADFRDFSHPLWADAVVSSAALHWVAEQEKVLRRCRATLRPGGRLLLQMGGRGNCAAILASASEVIGEPEWAVHLPSLPTVWHFLGPEDYRVWLPRSGFHPVRVELLQREMVHDDRAQLGDWMRTTWMPVLDRLPTARRPAFIAAVLDRYLACHPADSQGRTRVAMMRLEVEAVAM